MGWLFYFSAKLNALTFEMGEQCDEIVKITTFFAWVHPVK